MAVILAIFPQYWEVWCARGALAESSREHSEAKVTSNVLKGKWWAWVDLNHRPRPYQSSTIRFYNNLQNRGDCQNTRKSYKTSYVVGWIVGWKSHEFCGNPHFRFSETRSSVRIILRRRFGKPPKRYLNKVEVQNWILGNSVWRLQ
jgi:hypothetical protein